MNTYQMQRIYPKTLQITFRRFQAFRGFIFVYCEALLIISRGFIFLHFPNLHYLYLIC